MVVWWGPGGWCGMAMEGDVVGAWRVVWPWRVLWYGPAGRGGGGLEGGVVSPWMVGAWRVVCP